MEWLDPSYFATKQYLSQGMCLVRALAATIFARISQSGTNRWNWLIRSELAMAIFGRFFFGLFPGGYFRTTIAVRASYFLWSTAPL